MTENGQLFTNYTTGKVAYSLKDVFMNAAEKLFLEKGVAATTVTDILTVTKQGKKTFYNVFKSKEDIQAAMRQRYDRKIYTELSKQADEVSVNKPELLLKTWIETYIKLYINNYHIYDIMYDNSALNRYKSTQENPLIELLTGIIDNGNIEGVWNVEEPKLAAIMIKAGIQAIADDFVADVFSDYKQYYQTIYNYCRNMLN